MKKILGLDLGTNSIGWAVVNEAENSDEQQNFEKEDKKIPPRSTQGQDTLRLIALL